MALPAGSTVPGLAGVGCLAGAARLRPSLSVRLETFAAWLARLPTARCDTATSACSDHRARDCRQSIDTRQREYQEFTCPDDPSPQRGAKHSAVPAHPGALRRPEDHRQPRLHAERALEGDGIGPDITPVMIKVVDAVGREVYGGSAKIHWMEIYAGEKSTKIYGPDVWLPEETLAIAQGVRGPIKGPLTTPVGGGIRSLNVALRQELDLYVCLRPVRYFKGVPSPVEPEKVDMVIFRENTGGHLRRHRVRGRSARPEADQVPQTRWASRRSASRADLRHRHRRCRSKGTERLVRKAIQYAIDNDRSRHPGAQGQHHEVHRRASATGLRAGAEASSAPSRWTAARGCRSRTRRPARTSSSRTRSPTPSCSRSCCAGRVQRDRHAEPERRLHQRRAGGAGRRYRHRAGANLVGLAWPVRGHPRHRPSTPARTTSTRAPKSCLPR